MIYTKISHRERKKAESKERILKVARRLFQAKGFDAASVEEIAERADISKSTFFNYFDSKESLLYHIAIDEIEKIEAFIEEKLDAKLSAKEKIYLVMELMVEDTAPFLRLTKTVMQAISLITDEKTSPIMKMQNIITRLIEEGKKEGEFKPNFSSGEIASIIVAAYYMAFFKWVFNDGKFSSNEKAEFISLLDIVFEGASAKSN